MAKTRTRTEIFQEFLEFKKERDQAKSTTEMEEADKKFYPWLEELSYEQSQNLYQDLRNTFGSLRRE
jgi:hypothetical protein